MSFSAPLEESDPQATKPENGTDASDTEQKIDDESENQEKIDEESENLEKTDEESDNQEITESGDAGEAVEASKGTDTTDNVEYRMVCQCGAKNCRKFVF